jgi:hypothetical protein
VRINPKTSGSDIFSTIDNWFTTNVLPLVDKKSSGTQVMGVGAVWIGIFIVLMSAL